MVMAKSCSRKFGPPAGLAGTMQLQMGSAVVSTAAVGVPPTRRQQSPWRTIRWVESAAPSVRRDAEQSDRDGRAPLFRLHHSGLGPKTHAFNAVFHSESSSML